MSGVLAPYRERLQLLATDGVIESHLDAWAVAQSVAVAGAWRREYARLKPGRSPWAVLVYDVEGGPTVRVRLFESPEDGLGRIDISSCESDPALPRLPVVLAALEHPVVVRYRPGNRCTVRGGTASGVRYVKLVSGTPADDQVESRARWEASVSGALSFAVAEPHGWDERTQSSWYGVVPGAPLLPRLLAPDPARVAHQIGVALGELAVAPLVPIRSEGEAHQLARARRALARATAAAPSLTDGLQYAGDVLARAHDRLSPRPLVPVHGAAHLNQWLVDDDGRLGLIDFDRYAFGEPEFDLATFIVDLEREPSLPAAELEESVLAGFRAVGGEPDPERLALYRLHKKLVKVARTASALRPDAEARATTLFESLVPKLEDLD